MKHNPLLKRLIRGWTPSGDLRRDGASFLAHHNRAETAGHCARVAAQAVRLAEHFGVDAEAACVGGLLHDISTVIPNAERIDALQVWNLEPLPAEEAFPMIAHQRLSAEMARDLFGVHDAATLSAIGCHTTLKRDPSPLDQVVFIADKVEWDGAGDPPYINNLLPALERSLAAGCYCYLDYLWQTRQSLRVVHPWTVDGHRAMADALELTYKAWD